MIKVAHKKSFWAYWFRWGMPLAVYACLGLFAITTGWWQAAILGGYFLFSFILYAHGVTGRIGVIFITMLPIFQERIDRLQEWQDSVEEKILDEVEARESAVVMLNYEEQLFKKGIDAQGKALRPAYSPYTVQVKGFKGQPTDRVTLRDEGDFHSAFAIERNRGEFSIYSGDWKEAKLKAKYGEDIMGLTDQNLQRVIDMIRDPLIDSFRKFML